jgi:UDP-galactopyranose mutase
MTRCAAERRVFFLEEPVYDGAGAARLETHVDGGVTVVTPHLPPDTQEGDTIDSQRRLLDQLIAEQQITRYVLWYYTPMALAFSDHLEPDAVVFDCMDELSGFANAPATIKEAEAALLQRADVVFTGGQSLYEAKRHAHPNVHAFPSSVDVRHFARARGDVAEPVDQQPIPHPRLGYFGVIDERMDLALLESIARARPEWQLVMLGPVVKIDPASLPQLPNIHYLGGKKYDELPSYIASWDVALLPFARNDATRFISPTKTPEYMAAGKAVVSTSIRDVVRPYGELGLVRIADSPDDFIAACDAALTEEPAARLAAGDTFLTQTSWDDTWAAMRRHVDEARTRPTVPSPHAVAL